MRVSKKFQENYLKLSTLIISIIIGFFIFLLLYYGSFFVHEGGHIVYGTLDNWYNGRNSEFIISNWQTLPYLSFLKYPQQTRMIEGIPRLTYALGGSVVLVLVTIFVSYLFYVNTKRKIYWLFPLLFLYHEFFGNFLCGTDNPTGNSYEICKNLLVNNWVVPFIVAFLTLIVIIIYPKIIEFLRKILNKTKN